jgi:protein NRD1
MHSSESNTLCRWCHVSTVPFASSRATSRRHTDRQACGRFSEAELRGVFAKYGPVQTCIVNREKRHAFVKMYFRDDAVRAKEGMEEARSHDNTLRVSHSPPRLVLSASWRAACGFLTKPSPEQTRWGVGFGPRDCSDYSTGISVIPISKLTDADRKWMLTAEYGGSGGRPIVSGLSVEEPDIEIGAGVSSKAISRRMQTDKGGSHGPKSTRHVEDVNEIPIGGGNGDGGGRWKGRRDGRGGGGGGAGGGGGDGRGGHTGQRDGGGEARPAAPGEPIIPELPFGLTMGPNGMPIFPPGFSFPAPDAMQH